MLALAARLCVPASCRNGDASLLGGLLERRPSLALSAGNGSRDACAITGGESTDEFIAAFGLGHRCDRG